MRGLGVVLQENVINSKMSERSVHDFTAISLDNPKFQQVQHRCADAVAWSRDVRGVCTGVRRRRAVHVHSRLGSKVCGYATFHLPHVAEAGCSDLVGSVQSCTRARDHGQVQCV